MPVDIPDIDRHARSDSDEPGFTDEAFDARYDGKPACVSRSAAGRQATGPRSNPHAEPALPRSRNSFMRARRLSASAPP